MRRLIRAALRRPYQPYGVHKGLRTSLLVLLLLTLVQPAMAEITLVSPDEAVLPAQSVTFRFNASDAVKNCTLIINGAAAKTVQAAQNQETAVIRELEEGDYNWTVSCSTNASQIISQDRQLAIDLTLPEVRLITPLATFNTSTVNLIYQPLDKNLKNCTLFIDAGTGLAGVKTSFAPASGTDNAFTAELQDKEYGWSVRCSDKAGHTNAALSKNSFRVDTTPPSAAITQPLSVVTATSATLSLTTSEDSECRYSATEKNYSAMSQFAATGGKQHQQPLSFQSDGTYPYNMICRDRYGNSMDMKKVDIAVRLPPTAAISLSDSSPVNAGIIEVTVKTSKSMGSEPALTYAIGNGRETAVALSGANDLWKGNMLVQDAPQKEIAAFSFKGTDLEGYSGTYITEGKSFIIDTIKPPQPSSLNAEANEGTIFLNWYSSADDISQYKVYRSTSPSVSYLDYYSNANATSLVDASAEDKTTYYYSIAAVDYAGNIGELSETVYATARHAGYEAAAGEKGNVSTEQTLPAPQQKKPPLQPQLALEVNDAIKKIEAVKLSVEEAKATMNALSGRENELAVLIGVKGQADAASEKAGQIIARMEGLKGDYMEESELRSMLKQAEGESKQLERGTVKAVTIEERIEDLPVVKREHILAAINKVLPPPELGNAPANDYAAKNEKELQNIQLKTEAEIVKITTANGAIEEKSLITHRFTYAAAQPAKDSLIIVFIPKTIAASSKEITYYRSKPEVLQDDPVLKWGFLSMGPEAQEISYLIGRKLSADEVRQMQAVPLLNINKISESQESQGPTGFAVLSKIPKIPMAGTFWLIMPGLLMVVVIGGYYVLTTPRFQQKGNAEAEEEAQRPAFTQLNDRLSTIQVEIDEEIYPTLSSIRNLLAKKNAEGPAAGSHASGEQMMSSLISEARNCLAAGQDEKAKALYEAIQLLYRQLPKLQKAKYSTDCVWIYRQFGILEKKPIRKHN